MLAILGLQQAPSCPNMMLRAELLSADVETLKNIIYQSLFKVNRRIQRSLEACQLTTINEYPKRKTYLGKANIFLIRALNILAFQQTRSAVDAGEKTS